MKSPIENIVSKAMFWRGQGTINPGFESDGKAQGKGEAKVELEMTSAGDAEEGPARQQWSNPIEFLLSCVAMSVGLGNVWRFPFVALENGGGAFIIPYILVLLFIGKPLYYMELCLGQFASAGSVRVWDLAPAFRGVGYGQVLATWAVVTYYVSLMALTVFYFIGSFSSVLPWVECGPWATQPDICIGKDQNASTWALEQGINKSLLKSSADVYFNDEVLKIDYDGLDNGIEAPEWRLTLCLLGSWVVLFIILARGVQSSGKAAYFTALFPYLVLFIMLIRGATLDGALEGIKFFITPKWEKLKEPSVWYAAVSQSFFSLSVGFGSITMFSSYNDFRHNVYRDAAIISVTDTFTSLLAGFTTFAILGHLAHVLGVEVKDVVKGGGTGLAFISYPEVLARFDWVPQLFGVLFFLMLFTLGVGSASALTGCVITVICDEFPKLKRWLVTLVVCVVGFLLGLFYITPQGSYILTLIDHYGAGFIIFILAVLEVAAVQWVYGFKNFTRDIEFMLGRKTGLYWRICWVFLIPILLSVIFVYSQAVSKPLSEGSYVFGPGANAFGICLSVFACMLVPAFFVVEVMKRRHSAGSLAEAALEVFRPNAEWCPKDPALRRQYHEFVSTSRKELEGIDNPIPPVASVASLASLETTASKADITQFNTNV